MNNLILLFTLLKSLKPFMRKYVTTTLNIQEFLLVNNVFVTMIVGCIFGYNYFYGKETYSNIKNLTYYQTGSIILFSLLTIFSTFIFSKLEKDNNTTITSISVKLFSNILFLIIGVTLFNENITEKQMIGLLFCGIGIYLTSNKN